MVRLARLLDASISRSLLACCVVFAATPGVRAAPIRFSTGATQTIPVPPGGIQVDLNADGRFDYLSRTSREMLRLVVHRNLGSGSFASSVHDSPYVRHTGAVNATIALIKDLTGDGAPELVYVTREIISTCVWGPLVLMRNAGDGTFPAGQILRVDFPLESIQAIDLGVDGHRDLLVTTRDTSQCETAETQGCVYAVRNLGDGTFAAPAQYPPSDYATFGPATAGDMNGDGAPDLILPAEGIYLPNVTEAGFGLPRNIPVVTAPLWAASFDANQDQRDDIVVITASQLIVYLSDGMGGFTSRSTSLTGGARSLVADFGGNDSPDLVTCTANVCTALINDGQANWTKVAFANTGATTYLVTEDIDDNTYPDIIAASSSGLHLLLSQGDGTFTPHSFTPGSDKPPFVADFGGHGRRDYALFPAGYVVLNRGDGSFTQHPLVAGDGPDDPIVEDVDLDGLLDVVVRDGPSFFVAVNHGDGTFTYGPQVPGKLLQTADHDADGLLDFILQLYPPHLEIPVYSVVFGRGGGMVAGPRLGVAGMLDLVDVDQDGADEVIVDSGTGRPGVVPLPTFMLGGQIKPTTGVTPSGLEILDIASADFGGDSKPDVAIVGPNHLEVFVNQGPPDFYAVSQLVSDQIDPTRVATADFDEDDRPDLLTNGWLDFDVLFRNMVDDPFGTAEVLDLGAPDIIEVGDLDRDGLADLVLGSARGVELARGRGDGTFEPRVTALPLEPAAITIADLNVDGASDLLVVASGVLRVLYNDGSGAFTSGPVLDWGNLKVMAGDVDGDGALDIVQVGLGETNSLVVHRSTDEGTFERAFQRNFHAGEASKTAFLRDFNGDAKPDVLVGSVLVLNETDAPTPVLLQDARVTRDERGVHFQWRLSGTVPGLRAFELQRSAEPGGPYQAVNSVPWEVQPVVSYTDVDTDASLAYWYRLVLVLASGMRQPLWDAAVPALAATAPGPPRLRAFQNVRGRIEVHYEVPPGTAAIELFDVRGRLCRTLTTHATSHGQNRVEWEPNGTGNAPLGRGIYFVRLSTERTALSTRVVLLHR